MSLAISGWPRPARSSPRRHRGKLMRVAHNPSPVPPRRDGCGGGCAPAERQRTRSLLRAVSERMPTALIDDATRRRQRPEFSVSEMSGAVKRMIEGEFGHVRVRGEIGRVSRPRSGHVYLDLKDDRAVLAAVIWKGVAARLESSPRKGWR